LDAKPTRTRHVFPPIVPLTSFGKGSIILAQMNNILESLTHPPLNFPMLWLIFFMVMAVAEIFTPFFGLCLVGGCGLIAAVVAGMGFSFVVQVVVFGGSCLMTLLLLRPKILKKLHSSAHVPGRTESLHGHVGEVTHVIEPGTTSGRVTVSGQDWAAQSEQALPVGAKIRVVGADGIVLKVIRVSPV
jgi:membrane protein implicated in regulation of membrane protease activity